MPYLKLQTNEKFSGEKEIVKKLSKLIADELGKPESYVMVILENDLKISMGGDMKPAAFVELKSLGLSKDLTGTLSQVICEFLEDNIGIPAGRVYIVFSDVERSMWGWNGGTF